MALYFVVKAIAAAASKAGVTSAENLVSFTLGFSKAMPAKAMTGKVTLLYV